MAASAEDLLQLVGTPGTATTLSANYTAGNTSITVASTANWPTTTGVTFAMDEAETVNGEEVQVVGSYREFVGTVATATSVTNVDCVYGTDRDFSAGATTRVYIPVSAERENRIVEGMLQDHENPRGNHKTLTDANGNEWIEQGVTASATNHVKVTNAATGNAPTIESTGSDTNVGLIIDTKGTGSLDLRANWQGYITNVSQAPTAVTNNGNGSYTLTGASTWATWWAAGMKGRATRTVAAPTQCTSLNGTTQYWVKTSPSAMTWTDDFFISAWVEMPNYPAAGTVGFIVSRYNGTSGWGLYVNPSGQVLLVGYNGGSANTSYVQSIQSVPLNKWVHIAAQLDMSAFTATTTTSYVMLDGVDVPSSVGRSGTNPTALVQAGNLEIGSGNATNFFPGKIAQVAIHNAKIGQSNVPTRQAVTVNPGGSASMVSAYDFNGNTNDLNTTNANNLSAGAGSPTATNADSPFATNSDGTETGNLDYFVVMNVNGTSMTVQVPEGCTLPTSGGVSAMDIGIGSPFGFPLDKGRWAVETVALADLTTTSPVSGTWNNYLQLRVPTGVGELMYEGAIFANNTTNQPNGTSTLSTSSSSSTDSRFNVKVSLGSVNNSIVQYVSRSNSVSNTTQTVYYLNAKVNTASHNTLGFRSATDESATVIRWVPAGI